MELGWAGRSGGLDARPTSKGSVSSSNGRGGGLPRVSGAGDDPPLLPIPSCNQRLPLSAALRYLLTRFPRYVTRRLENSHTGNYYYVVEAEN